MENKAQKPWWEDILIEAFIEPQPTWQEVLKRAEQLKMEQRI